MSFDEIYLPHELGENVAENDLTAEPVFALLEIKYGTPLVEAAYKLEAATADPVTRGASSVGRQPDLPDQAHVVCYRQSARRL
jgi:GntR family transcriptional regulator